ncbi:transglutaminase-like domain-containing protein [Oceanobacillus manasiensis]|uniref:transglutaminase-like domain-containing protein n=1 Tax=Oceanobacillus manasiensis TaxID=586413 RepID=UPI0005AB2539|nr:transglutaminase-like domain-containing protein [Oceanobacillus manasiensis]
MKENPIGVNYVYKNTLDQTIELWIPIPEEKSTTLKPTQLHKLPTGEDLGYFLLHKNDTLHLQYTQKWYKPKQLKYLTEEEITYYLRDTTLSPVNKETLKMAKDITKGIKNKKAQAKAIFQHIVTSYKYHYPPKSRGVESFLRTKSGDCGEFSFLFSSLCRSLGIPTRTLFGSWSTGRMSGHAWNEIHVEDEGWVAVDVSMANLQKNKPLRFLDSDLRTMRWTKYFGETEGQRIVFSHDAEIRLHPRYRDNKDYTPAMEPTYVNDQAFYWGQESLNGAAPYLQPAYVKIDMENLLPDTSLGVENYFGTWETKEVGWRGYIAKSKKYAALVGIATMATYFLSGYEYLALFYKISFIALFTCFILRRERVILFSVLLIFMILSFVSTVSELV